MLPVKLLIIYIILCNSGAVLCLAHLNDENTFNYDDPTPDYVVGKEITPNKPDIAVEGGTFSISPSLSNGLSLEPTSGAISGIPEEEYENKYTVAYSSSNGAISTSIIEMKIWDIPTVLTCGLVKINIAASVTDSFPCKSDKKVEKWLISFNPSDSYPISISQDGVLSINNMSPPDNQITVTITTDSPAGESATSTSIIISKADVVIKSGLNIKVDHINSFLCGPSSEIKTIYNSKVAIIDNLDGLEGNDSYSAWDNKLGGFLSSNNAFHWNYTIEGAIYIPENNSYYFSYNSDFARYDIYFDDETTTKIYEHGYSKMDAYNYYSAECSVWTKSAKRYNKEMVLGYHPIKIVGHYTLRQIECVGNTCKELAYNSTYRFRLQWRISGETEDKPINFKMTNPYSNGEITVQVSITVLPTNEPIKIWSNDSVVLEAGKNYENFRLFYVIGKNIEYKVDNLPKGLELDKKSSLISGMVREETSMVCEFRAKNSYGFVDMVVIINVTLPIEPNNIKYEEKVTVIFGMSYGSLQPYECLAKTISYSVEPELPEGLVIDKKTGIINGRVNVEPPATESYTFRCYNDAGSIDKPITITIQESIEPVIINHVDNITIEGGKDHYKIYLCRVTGQNLVYTIIPNLPFSTLKFDTSSGTISGYIANGFDPVNATIVISGSGKHVFFNFMLRSLIPDTPEIVESTIVHNKKLKFSEPIRAVYLFVAVGTNLEISVKPNLPKGLLLDSKSGEIFGIAMEYVERTTYTFTVQNPPSTEVKTVDVEIEFEAVYCETDSGFPRTPAETGGIEVIVKCGGSETGAKKRKCYLSDDGRGIWSEIDDSECRMSDGAIAGIAVGSVAVALIVIILAVVFLLRTGMFRHRARTQSTLRKIPISDDKEIEGQIKV